MTVRAANSPASWGIEPPEPVTDPPWTRVLDEIARAGYPGTELGPLGYLPRDPDRLTEALAQRRLSLAAGFVMAPLADADAAPAIVAATRETAALLRAGGAGSLILMDALGAERAPTAGRSDDARRLDGAAWGRLTDAVRRVAAVAAGEFGLRVSFHPHVGTNVEFEDEIERLLGDIAADELALCPDTGHLTYAGIDPLAMLRRHRDRVGYLHLKDVDDARLARVRRERIGFYDAVAAGIFRPLGDGCVDFDGLRTVLGELGYDGWATVEQDRLPESTTTPFDEALRSREFLVSAGIAR
jgi:inosose dehydratase